MKTIDSGAAATASLVATRENHDGDDGERARGADGADSPDRPGLDHYSRKRESWKTKENGQ